jgi:hypothetical protein
MEFVLKLMRLDEVVGWPAIGWFSLFHVEHRGAQSVCRRHVGWLNQNVNGFLTIKGLPDKMMIITKQRLSHSKRGVGEECSTWNVRQK